MLQRKDINTDSDFCVIHTLIYALIKHDVFPQLI